MICLPGKHNVLAEHGSIVKTAGVDKELLTFAGPARVLESQEAAVEGVQELSERQVERREDEIVPALGIADGARIRLFLEMSVGAEEPGDCVQIQGEPPVRLTIHGGLNGDLATVGRVLNSIEEVVAGPSGLATILTLPLRSQKTSQIRERSPELVGSARLL